MAYKVFTNGSTLQASELNENLMQQSVAVFSNASARTAAITSPVEGQMTYLEDTNQFANWSGSAWVPAMGLTSVYSASLTAQSSVQINNVFSSAFTNYYFTISGRMSADTSLLVRYSSGGTNSNANYAQNVTFWTNASGPSRNYSTGNTSTSVGFVGADVANVFGTIYNPFLAQRTSYLVNYNGWGSVVETGVIGGSHAVNSSYDGILFTTGSAITFTGRLNIYGMKDA